MSFKIIALDQGTTSSRALLINEKGHIEGITQKEFTQYFPKSGWVEHNPEEIWSSQHDVLVKLIRDYQVDPGSITAIGITNQRETAIVWDKNTGEPIYPAIVWQDKRTAPICEDLKNAGLENTIKEKSGLIIDSYFSGTKVKWILDNVDGAREKANAGRLAFGTVDSWLIWKLTKGKNHVTDTTNASRTMLFDIHNLSWDDTLMEALDIPKSMMPEVLESSSNFGVWEYDGNSIPISSILGDQQAALFGQNCFNPGEAKNTYGTGCFMLMNTGEKAPISKSGLLTTIAWSIDGKTDYALEGSIFIAGAAVQWLRDALKVIDTAEDSEYYARKVPDTSDHVYVVPAFAGLGAPYWDMYARGAIFGLTRDTGKNQIIRATLDSLAFQTRDVLQAMEKDSGLKLDSLQVDGGAVANNYLMQLQSDILGVPVIRPQVTESTAIGAAYLAGITQSVWDKETVAMNRKIDQTFDPVMSENEREERYAEWQKAVERTLGWLK